MKKSLISILWLFSVAVLIGCGSNSAPTQNTTAPSDNSNTNPQVADTVAPDAMDVDDQEVVVANDWEVAVDVEFTTRLANCMTENGTKMYGTARCSHCNDQRALFGDGFANVEYTDCDDDRQSCLDAWVRGFPTWINGEWDSFPGTQTLSRLAAISGCEDIQ
jgi:hypothetical protein